MCFNSKQRPPTAGVPRAVSLTATILFSLSAPALAQRAGIDSPGAPAGGGLGQTTRFDNEFNPAISLTADLLVDYVEYDGVEHQIARDGYRTDMLSRIGAFLDAHIGHSTQDDATAAAAAP